MASQSGQILFRKWRLMSATQRPVVDSAIHGGVIPEVVAQVAQGAQLQCLHIATMLGPGGCLHTETNLLFRLHTNIHLLHDRKESTGSAHPHSHSSDNFLRIDVHFIPIFLGIIVNNASHPVNILPQ